MNFFFLFETKKMYIKFKKKLFSLRVRTNLENTIILYKITQFLEYSHTKINYDTYDVKFSYIFI